jgi:hypothetical protein
MMNPIADDMRRFILTLPSVPHLEAMLLLRSEPERQWEADALARQLYIGQEQAARVLDDLANAGICAAGPLSAARYSYRPHAQELDDLIGRLADFYSRNLIEVTNIIHANSRASQAQKVQRFADAFKWRKEK